jgi:2,3-diaminopropionate biosynthesis protein SbnA
MIHASVIDAIGGTPLIHLSRVMPDLPFTLYGKMEGFNPGGSAKDRPAARMLSSAMARGDIGPHTTIVESSSGNMAIGLAQACACLGLQLICVIDARTTLQHRKLLAAYGATIDIVKPADGDFLAARIARVKEIVATHGDVFWPNQYANPDNARSHRQTASEIFDETPVDYLFCATSTCGTLRGCSDYVAEHDLPARLVAVDAAGSAIFGDARRPRLIPGHGASIRPPLVEGAQVSTVLHVSDLDCVVGCRRLATREGLLVGGSAGGVITAIEGMRDVIPAGSVCVAILADCGERYVDTIYSDAWVQQHFGEVAHLWERSVDSGDGRRAAAWA